MLVLSDYNYSKTLLAYLYSWEQPINKPFHLKVENLDIKIFKA